MKLTIGTDPNLPKIKKVVKKVALVLLAVNLITVVLHYTMYTIIQKNYPDIFMQNNALFAQITEIAGILFGISLLWLILLSLVLLQSLIEKPMGQFIFDYEKDDIRYRETAAYKETIAYNKPKLKEAIKKKDLKFLLMMADDYKDRGYWVEEAEILAMIIGKDPAGKYGIQAADKIIEIDY